MRTKRLLVGGLVALFTSASCGGKSELEVGNPTPNNGESASSAGRISVGERQPCGPDGLSCNPGDVCAIHPAASLEYTCVSNPCVDEPTSCECAATLCRSFESCSMYGQAVLCTCFC